MFGLNPKNPEGNLTQTTATIFDVSTADFETRVISASMEKPIIVVFWTPGCEPCKHLLPILESATNTANGDMLLAKVNLDENSELAQALQVQYAPTVFAFFSGRPVDAFQGAQPENVIKAFMDKILQAARADQPGAIDIPKALNAAFEAFAEKDLRTAQGLYAQILQQDEKNVTAYTGMVRTFIAAGMIEQATELIDNAPPEISSNSEFSAARTALEMAQKASEIDLKALHKAVKNATEDHQPHIDLAEGLFATGQQEQAVEILLERIEIDREWNDHAARKALLKMFEALGHSQPLTIQGRKKLSTILFS